MNWIDTIILSIVEGITEFLPISSTGHMIIASSIIGISENEFTKLFEVCVQLGAILAVVVLYWKKFFDVKRIDFYLRAYRLRWLPGTGVWIFIFKKDRPVPGEPCNCGRRHWLWVALCCCLWIGFFPGLRQTTGKT